MKKVIQIVCNSKNEYNSVKSDSYIRLYFKKMSEGDGSYEISNKGHVRSNRGQKKILKYQYHTKKRPRINLQNKNNKQEKHYILHLMIKYHPTEIKEWKEINLK